MKRLFLILLSFLFWGCEKYELITPPVITGGKWVFYDYEIVPITWISSHQIVKNDTICINSWNNQSFVSGDIVMKQNFNSTARDRRFVVGRTTWEFDGTVGSPFYYLSTEFRNFGGTFQPSHSPFDVELLHRLNKISIYNTENGAMTYYTYDFNEIKSNGVTPTNKMTLLSEPIITDVYLSNGTRDKAITVRILLKFMR
jgi:hypothetical protein